jgi:thiol-disulfide isomerase/thioredoxin
MTKASIQILSCIVALFASCRPVIRPLKTGLEGTVIPSFNILLEDSTTYFNTGSIPSGKPAVVFYFSPYCPYCRLELKDIIRNNASLSSVNIYMVTNFSFSSMKTFYVKNGLSRFANITVGYDSAYFVSTYYKTRAVPFTAIYGGNKRLSAAFLGPVKAWQINQALLQ